MSIVPGKAYASSDYKNVKPRSLGLEDNVACVFTADMTDDQLVKRSAFDLPNLALNYAPNASNAGATSTAIAVRPHTYQLIANGSTAALQTIQGFTPLVTAGFGSTFSIDTTANTIWNSVNNIDFFRHFLYGRVRLELDLHYTAITNAHALIVNCNTTYDGGAGTSVTITEQKVLYGALGFNTNAHCTFDTRGSSEHAPYSGLAIKSITVTLSSSANTTTITNSNVNPLFLSAEFSDVMADTKYIAAIIVGAATGYRIAMDLTTHTEVLVDPNAKAAQFVENDETYPYSKEFLPLVVSMHSQVSKEPLEAAGFMKTMKKIGKGVSKVYKVVKPFAKAAYGIGKSFLPDPVNEVVDALSNLQSTTFGSGSTIVNSLDSYTYPAVTAETDGVHYYATLPIVTNGVQDREVSNAFRYSTLGFVSSEVKGRSGTLALVLAKINELGIPTRPGHYSGEVSNVRLWKSKGDTEISFDIYPVDSESDKIKDSLTTSANLTGLFPQGWYTQGAFHEFDPRDIFVEGLCKVTTIDPPQGYPGKGINIQVKTNRNDS